MNRTNIVFSREVELKKKGTYLQNRNRVTNGEKKLWLQRGEWG